MGKTFSYRVRECLVANNKAGLLALMESPDFVSEKLTTDIFVELIQLRWDSPTVLKFAKLANDDQLAATIATAILQAHSIKLKDLFQLMADPTAAIARNQLAPLFLVALDHEDLDAVQALIEFECYTPTDPRPILASVRKQAGKGAPQLELVQAVLNSHPGHKDTAKTALDEWVPHAKTDSTKEGLSELLQAYLKA